MSNIELPESILNTNILDTQSNLNYDFSKIININLSIVQIITIIVIVFLIKVFFNSFIIITLIFVIAFEIIFCRLAKINSPLNVLIFGEFPNK